MNYIPVERYNTIHKICIRALIPVSSLLHLPLLFPCLSLFRCSCTARHSVSRCPHLLHTVHHLLVSGLSPAIFRTLVMEHDTDQNRLNLGFAEDGMDLLNNNTLDDTPARAECDNHSINNGFNHIIRYL